MDRYRIDSHKLMYHTERLHRWLRGDNIYPIYMEASPAGACNHRCRYCGLDFMEYKYRYLDTAIFKERLSELGELGLKSIMYAGEGEPFLHKDFTTLVSHAKASGIDVGVTTNGVFLKEDIAEDIMFNTEWIKVGIDGATKETYSKIHRCRAEDFDNVVKNITDIARLKKNNGYKCTLGVQFLLLPENHKEVKYLAKMVRDIGMDYLVIKPYSQHTQSKTKAYSSIKYGDYKHLAEELTGLSTDTFSIIFRAETMKAWDENSHNYGKCFGFPFWSYIDAVGNVWGCSVYLGDERFHYGNIYEQSFKQIWESEKRLKSLKWSQDGLDISNCRINCRMDKANKYLWELKNPIEHVNFI